MKSLAELREFFSRDRYATATTGIEILEAQDGYAKVGLAVHEGHMNAGNRVMGAVYYTMADFAFAVASNPDAGDAQGFPPVRCPILLCRPVDCKW